MLLRWFISDMTCKRSKQNVQHHSTTTENKSIVEEASSSQRIIVSFNSMNRTVLEYFQYRNEVFSNKRYCFSKIK